VDFYNMPNQPDTREIDPEREARIEAARIAAIEAQPSGGFSEIAENTKAQPFMKSLKTGAVVDLTEQARSHSYEQDLPDEPEMRRQIEVLTGYVNDLRDRVLGGRNE
jgi:hypothetical protein